MSVLFGHRDYLKLFSFFISSKGRKFYTKNAIKYR